MSSSRVEQLLATLKTDPTVVIELYPALSEASFWVLIDPTEKRLPFVRFLTYPTKDEVFELPVFFSLDDPILIKLKEDSGAEPMLLDGPSLFRRAQDIIETGKTELALISGTDGIRINRSILLSIIAVSANPPSREGS